MQSTNMIVEVLEVEEERLEPIDVLEDMPEDNEADLSTAAGLNGRTQRKAGQLTVIDVSGIHHITVLYCQCSAATERYRQLLDLRLYPASCDRPATVFTFAVLDDFILHNRACNTPAQSYFNVLQRITDPIQPHLTSVRVQNCHNVLLLNKCCRTATVNSSG